MHHNFVLPHYEREEGEINTNSTTLNYIMDTSMEFPPPA
jgi:hypothetical protein